MERYKYMRIPIDIIPPDIFEMYELQNLVHNGYVVVEIRKEYGYHECAQTPGLFKHKERPIMFTLVVDDFGIKSVGKEHAMHLYACIKSK